LPALKLTERLCSRALPPGEIADSVVTGLYLVVHPSGRKSWAYRCRVAGRSVKVTIGGLAAFTLEEARARAGEMVRAVARGRDPRAATGRTTREVFEEWMRRDQSRNRSADVVRAIYERDVLPIVGELPIAEVDRRRCRELIERVADRGSPVAARRLHAHLHKMLRWCVGVDALDRNPMYGLPMTGSETPRERVLDAGEVRRVWDACPALGYPFGPIVRLLLLTGARRGEVAGLAWAEVAGDAIALDGARTKSGRPHSIPLSAAAIAVLAELPRTGPLVFSTTGETAPSGFSRAKLRLDALSGVADWTIHDIRRTVATGLQELGQRLEVIEAVLGHVGGSRGGIVGVYQRHKFEPEKREGLRLWAEHVSALQLSPRFTGATTSSD
jgi:integrase